MEEGAHLLFKVPPPGIEFTLPSPKIGIESLEVVDSPWELLVKTKVEEVTINQERHVSLFINYLSTTSSFSFLLLYNFYRFNYCWLLLHLVLHLYIFPSKITADLLVNNCFILKSFLKRSLVTATKTRKKQQTELIKMALQAQDDKKREEREKFLITTIPITIQAAHEPSLYHTEEHEEGN